VGLLEQGLQLLQLLGREGRPVPALSPPAEHVLREQIAGQRRYKRTSHCDGLFMEKVRFLVFLVLYLRPKVFVIVLFFLEVFQIFSGYLLDFLFLKLLKFVSGKKKSFIHF